MLGPRRLWNDPLPNGPGALSIRHFARETKPLIFFDSLIGFHDGKKQDASETRRHLQHYRMLAAEGATPVIFHHTRKAESSKQYRGSSDIKASVDCAYLLDRLGDQTEGLASLRLVPLKSRFSLPKTIRLQCVSGRLSISPDKAETNREIIERIIQTHPGFAESALVLKARGCRHSKTSGRKLAL
jgi:hypothetical protein